MIRLLCSLLLISGLPYAQAQSYAPQGQSYAPQGQSYRQDGSRPDFDSGVSAAQAGNYAVAYCIWKPLADQGHVEAQYRLGWLYAKGLGLAVDEASAINWWKQAGEQKHVDALFSLGWAYEHGDGTEKNIALAMKYYLQAASLGQEDAVELLQLMLMRNNKEVMQGIGSILESNPEAIGKLTKIGVAKANIRKGSNKNAKLLRTLKQGDAVVVLGNRSNWLRIWIVEHKQFGWVFKRLVSGFEK